jgi:peptidoglycan/xylan/chitin deacetylase (PgdA/CDA1 family)
MNITRRDFLRIASVFTASSCVAAPATASVFSALKGSAAGGPAVRVPVLLYHDISDLFNDDYTISPSLFAAQMEWLYNNGYRAISLRDIPNLKANDKAVVITFDDGYDSFVYYAFPIFRACGFKATINVIGNLVGKYIDEGGSRPLLSWDEYRFLLNSGLVDIGSHTYALHRFDHKGVIGVSEETLRQELRIFIETMLSETGQRADILAWPYGFYNEKSVEVARQEGFRYIQTSNTAVFETSGDLFAIPRKNITNRFNLAVFRTEVMS